MCELLKTENHTTYSCSRSHPPTHPPPPLHHHHHYHNTRPPSLLPQQGMYQTVMKRHRCTSPVFAAEQRKAKFRLDPASCTSWGENHSLRPILSPDPLQPHLPPPQEGMHQTARVKGRETPMHIPSVASEQRKAKFRLDPCNIYELEGYTS